MGPSYSLNPCGFMWCGSGAWRECAEPPASHAASHVASQNRIPRRSAFRCRVMLVCLFFPMCVTAHPPGTGWIWQPECSESIAIGHTGGEPLGDLPVSDLM